jgi:methylmalonyl-CoA mutase C-terminal domain/subunit
MNEQKQRPIKVIIAKLGLDGHDRGAKVLVLGLQEEGMEVHYAGLRQTPESVVDTAIRENVDVIGLSSMAGGYNHYFPRVIEVLREREVSKKLVIGGGIIPAGDVAALEKQGIARIFGPGTHIKDVAEFIRANVDLK